MRFSIYFILLTLGPVLIGISLSITTYLSTLTFFANTISIGNSQYNFLTLLPLIATTFAFTLLYKIVPNVKIPFTHALIGGIVAAVLFELAKRGFAFFITSFSTYQLIYGALAAIPLTLIWLYVSWLVILIGAEVTASSSDYLKTKNKLKPKIDLCVALKLLGDIGFLNKQQDSITLDEILNNESHISDETIITVLNKLEENELIKQHSNIWQLSRDKSVYNIQELLSMTSPCCGDYMQQKDNEFVYIENALDQLDILLKKSPPILLQTIFDKSD